ncbi:MAG TPA: bifunctional acetaldehyde-CoA/alcohol dehydrogenase [Deltaproteobacteria bacterium]|jgi:acetaldehyde dehydrogenase/alcohol dehydrogenase|nr:bifunctional acetaldehyde-CoA/alcohol dehydrogenase [Deltaproteobacteria bacterium]
MADNQSESTFQPGRAAELDHVVARARGAAAAFRRLDQDGVDRIVWAMVVAGLEKAVELAQVAIEETGFGVFEDKVVKNYVATEFLYDFLKDKRTVGVIGEDPERNIQYVAEPIGVVLAILPVTNPTSTVLFKAIVAAKTRNAIIFRPSPRAIRCALHTVEILRKAAEKAGMPPDALQVIPDAPREATHYLFEHPGIDLIWTTGGPRIVNLSNRAGKPVISVGPGNAPVYLHRTADLPGAIVDILISKTFDASVICPAEQTCVIDAAIWEAALTEFQRMGAHLLTPPEVERLGRIAFLETGEPNIAAVGQSPQRLAEMAGFAVDVATKVLLAPLPSDLDALGAHPLVHEKLMPVLGVVRAASEDDALAACDLVTARGGLGHTCAIYARDSQIIQRYAATMRTGRILVNAPTAVGALGGVYNSLTPTFSLGCGTWGGSMTTDNVNYRNLLNIKTVSRRLTPPQWFRVPSDTYFNAGALENLRQVQARTVVLVTDSTLERSGTADEIRRHVSASTIHVFSDIEPEPTETQIRAGVELLRRMSPDLLIAVGGGSVLDAAKAMRLFYESPELSVRELSLPFLDARKRVARYPRIAHQLRLVAIPTTAGTGSEVSPASVVTVGQRKLTLVDYSLVPDMAIVDPLLSLSLPPGATADTGVDALTHAVEAYVSIFASPYTDAFCAQATRLILDALPRAMADGSDLAARTAMANAATIAGLAFSNAFVGVNHALAHAVGARFHLTHGRANGIFLPHVMRYNAAIPTKFMPAPGYSAYVAPEKYAQLGWVIGLGGHSEAERRERFFHKVDGLLDRVGIPRSLAEAGIRKEEFESALPELARAAFEDPSLRTNPRMPLVRELEELLRAGWRGR